MLQQAAWAALLAALLLPDLVAGLPWHSKRASTLVDDLSCNLDPRNLQPEKVDMAHLESGLPLSACLRMMPSSSLTTSGLSLALSGARSTC